MFAKRVPRRSDRIRVLFIDETNGLQSQVAEYFLNRMYPEVYEAFSAGPRFDCIDCELIASMFQNGHDIRGQRAKDFRSKQIPVEFDYLVFLERDTYERIGPHVPYDAPHILMDFGGGRDLRAEDDRGLFEAYTALIGRVRDWVGSAFRDPGGLEGMVI